MLALFAVDERLQVQLVWIANFVGGHDPRPERPVGIERLAQRHRWRTALPVAHAHVVYDHVAGDHLVGAIARHMAASPPDYESELAFVVQRRRRARQVDRIAGSRDADSFSLS